MLLGLLPEGFSVVDAVPSYCEILYRNFCVFLSSFPPGSGAIDVDADASRRGSSCGQRR